MIMQLPISLSLSHLAPRYMGRRWHSCMAGVWCVQNNRSLIADKMLYRTLVANILFVYFMVAQKHWVPPNASQKSQQSQKKKLYRPTEKQKYVLPFLSRSAFTHIVCARIWSVESNRDARALYEPTWNWTNGTINGCDRDTHSLNGTARQSMERNDASERKRNVLNKNE